MASLPPFLSDLSLPPPPSISLVNIALPLLILSERFSFYPGSYIFKLLSSLAFLSGPLYYLSPTPPPLPSTLDAQSLQDYFIAYTDQFNPYHLLIAAGLLASILGDYLLIPTRTDYYNKHFGAVTANTRQAARQQAKEESGETETRKITVSFQLGVVAFALAHIAYILAFVENNVNKDTETPVNWPVFGTTLAATLLLSKWLGVIYPPKGKKGGVTGNVLNLAISGPMRPLVFAYSIIIGCMLAVAASTEAAEGDAPSYQRVLGAAMFVASDVFVAKDAFARGRAGKPGWLRPLVGFGLYFWAQMLIAGTV
ncbi:hypothetical protein AJ79_01622 [Helicocarpus griseus UAMH5409]|uniref:YhhN domain-containing protein n=1 Tax=Helicocarpus griseus UAMH5409 TaxID=1447875 RepID=A0A2B7Y7D3_9EURO|nr:hypothetical protein AJ79_01622 [Helicocarpus griseus UAMH5409]